jgi:hypothetical protein
LGVVDCRRAALGRRDVLNRLRALDHLQTVVELGLGNVSRRIHLVEDVVAARGIRGVTGFAGGRLLVRVLNDRDEGRRLHRREFGGALAVVPLRGRLDTVGRAAKRRNVEVGEEDVLLAVLLLERDRELRLLELAVKSGRIRYRDCGGLILQGW